MPRGTRKVAADVIELLIARIHSFIVNIHSLTGNKSTLDDRYDSELSQAATTELPAATKPQSRVSVAWWRAQKYPKFRQRVKEKCNETIQRLCDIFIRKDWISHMRSGDIKKLHLWLENEQNKSLFDRAKQIDDESRENAPESAASAPDAVHIHKKEMTIESFEDTTFPSTRQENLCPSPAIAAPLEPSATETTEFHAKWSRQGITACFGDTFAHATESCDGRSITMTFPEVAQVGCFITFNLDLTATQRLAQALTDISVYRMDNGPPPSGIYGTTMTVIGEIKWTAFTRDAITNALGHKILEYVDGAPGRGLELMSGMQFCTSGVRMVMAKESGELSIATSITAGQNIRDCLQIPV